MSNMPYNLTKFYQRMWLIAGVIKWTLILQGVPPTKFGRVKNVGNSVQFLTTFGFDRKYLRNRWTYWKYAKYLINYISSATGRMKLCELWFTNNKVIYAHVDPPNWAFSEEYGLSNFYTLYTGQRLLVHTTNRFGVPPNIKGEHLKLGLKFHTCAPITLGVVGIISRIFTRGCGSSLGW